jgi:MOB kinase activator 1
MVTIVQFLSPHAAKALDPVCTLTQSTSAMTISARNEEPYSHFGTSNQRTRNQFRPRTTTKGTTGYQLRQYAEATLGGGSLRKIVKLPEGEDENEWLAVNSRNI